MVSKMWRKYKTNVNNGTENVNKCSYIPNKTFLHNIYVSKEAKSKLKSIHEEGKTEKSGNKSVITQYPENHVISR